MSMPTELLSRSAAPATVHTSRFGPLSVDEHVLLTFPEGLPGFESRRTFVFVPHPVADGAPASPFPMASIHRRRRIGVFGS